MTKTENALVACEKVLNGIEDNTITVTSALLLCLKIARLLNDTDAIMWLQYEYGGYPRNKNGYIQKEAWQIAWGKGRGYIEDGKELVFSEIASELAEKIEKRSPEVFAEYKERLTAKVNETLADGNLDESVLATELVIYADKICVDEELVRLKSHISHMRDTLEKEETVGRKLDFITQELNREANTTLSKANDIVIADLGIMLKTEIEKIREQIQNLE